MIMMEDDDKDMPILVILLLLTTYSRPFMHARKLGVLPQKKRKRRTREEGKEATERCVVTCDVADPS